MTTVIMWIMAVIFVEAVTEIMISGAIFEWLRRLLCKFSKFTEDLISCGYCLSVWVSASIAWAVPMWFDSSILNFIVATFVLHRLSNAFHELMSKWLGRVPLSIQLHKIETVMIKNKEEDNNG